MSDNIVNEKAILFAVRIVKLYQYLTSEKKEFVLSKQLLRSGTSIGANIAEALSAVSRRDFLSKMYVAFKECSESLYWIELLHRTAYLTLSEYKSICANCIELRQMLSSITKTTKATI